MKKYRVHVNGKTYDVAVEDIGEDVSAAVSGPQSAAPSAPPAQPLPAGSEVITAPMPGKVLAIKVDKGDAKGLRELADTLKDRLGSGVIVLGCENEGNANLLVAVTKDLTARERKEGENKDQSERRQWPHYKAPRSPSEGHACLLHRFTEYHAVTFPTKHAHHRHTHAIPVNRLASEQL